MKFPSKSIAACLLAVTIAAGAFFLSSCSPSGKDKIVYTGVSVTQLELSVKLGYNFISDKYASASYEVVDYDWLVKSYHDIFWAKIFDESITKWDNRANCTIFTEEYVGILQKMYFRDHFHSFSKTERLAIGEFWYIPNPTAPLSGHSVVIAYTNKGVVFIEPQSREKIQLVNLTEADIASRILRKF